jgi:hypothetical protein
MQQEPLMRQEKEVEVLGLILDLGLLPDLDRVKKES